MLEVTVVSPHQLLFEGQARQVIFPGEHGVFEVGPFHRSLVSRLLPGRVLIDQRPPLTILRGVVQVHHDTVVAIVEPAGCEDVDNRETHHTEVHGASAGHAR